MTTIGRRTKRQFSPEQKFQIVQDIKASPTIKAGLEKNQITSGMYTKWKRQLEVGIQASLRNTKPIQPPNQRWLEIENRKLMEMVLNLTHDVCELKKTFSLKP